jgi:hypothetical protein
MINRHSLFLNFPQKQSFKRYSSKRLLIKQEMMADLILKAQAVQEVENARQDVVSFNKRNVNMHAIQNDGSHVPEYHSFDISNEQYG